VEDFFKLCGLLRKPQLYTLQTAMFHALQPRFTKKDDGMVPLGQKGFCVLQYATLFPSILVYGTSKHTSSQGARRRARPAKARQGGIENQFCNM
jgi:hypothetical protein